MKRNFSDTLNALDGAPIQIGASVDGYERAINSIFAELPDSLQIKYKEALEKEVGKPLTLSTVCCTALLSPHEGEEAIAPEEQIRRVELSRKIYNGGIVDITAAERDLLRTLTQKQFKRSGALIPVVIGELLEKDAKDDSEAQESQKTAEHHPV